MKRTRYQFMRRAEDTYYWTSTEQLPHDSRYEQVSCGVEYFWASPARRKALKGLALRTTNAVR